MKKFTTDTATKPENFYSKKNKNKIKILQTKYNVKIFAKKI